ncbi:HAD-IB family hydrolase [Kitasatospora cinereorecta]|uniref:HAD family hydrolase n=1 Tax=Kitasatospora cinereorecta TaxID=285560 RepID=A0ABW0VK16_9ACTN
MPTVRLVFADVDETLIGLKSMFDFHAHYLTARHGEAGARRAARFRVELTARAAAGLPREQSNRVYYRAWAGEVEAEVAAAGRRWFAERSAVPGFYLPATRAALAAHRADGAAIALVSGSFAPILDPIAEDVGAAHLVCSRPEVRGGRYTGGLTGEPVIGAAKRAAVRALLGAHPDLDPADCWAYGDHVSDLPMLAEVGRPVVVGADPELLALLPGADRLPAGRG